MQKIELNILIFILIEALFLSYGIKITLINLILGTILGIILIMFFSKIKKYRLIKIILLLVSIFLLINSFIDITYFITNNLLYNYSFMVILLSLIITSYLLIKNGYHSFIKSIEIFFYFFLILKIISLFLTIPNVNFNNINNNLLIELKPNINLLFIGLIILYLHQTLFYLTNHKISKKIFLISILNPIIIKTISIMVIGINLYNLYNYPYINVLKRINYLNFIERMEGILSFEYLFCFITLLSFLLLTTNHLIKKESK